MVDRLMKIACCACTVIVSPMSLIVLVSFVGCTTRAPSVAPASEPTTGGAVSVVAVNIPIRHAATAPSEMPAIPATEIAAAAAQSFDRGVEWVLENQLANGGWGSFETVRVSEVYLDTIASHLAFHTATSALIAWALVEPARSDARCRGSLDRALCHLSIRDAPGRASGKTFYGVWSHTYLLDLAAAVVGEPTLAPFHESWRAIMSRELLAARSEQATEGGFGYYDFNFVGIHPSGEQSTSFNTAAMILAIQSAQRQGGIAPVGTTEDATRALLRMQLPSGTFAYGTYAELLPRADYNKVSGSNGRLQCCNVALHAVGAGSVTEATLLRGVQHLRDAHHYIAISRGRTRPHEAFYRNSGYYYYFGHYYAARALAIVPPSPARAELVRWLAEVMVHDQNPDGSWFDYPLYGYGRAYASGFALLTLEILKPLIQVSFPESAVGHD